MFPFASSLTAVPEKQPAAKLRVLARTTPRAGAETKDPVDLSPLRRWKPGKDSDQYVVGMEASGSLVSAFPSGETMGPLARPARSVRDAHVLVLSSSQFLANPFVRVGLRSEPAPSAVEAEIQEARAAELKPLADAYAKQALVLQILTLKNTLDWIQLTPNDRACVTRH